ncbi:glycosyltransferase [Robertkochia marina]|uniref:Glycosyltransferase n=1 Tax=Robertkochia marina TaxID=1227945 RepID=A0A4S3LX54_9FLAO|nr:glycosyltransferase [Robertkochia marina]THD65755.1 glycosyltransferase [Robertkochia marina]TRZ46560.1 glycosyltransferase [Robertkochia marina]
MNILHLSGAMVWGGNENQLAHFVTGHTGEALEQTVFCFEGAPIHKFCKSKGVRYYSVPKSGSFSLRTARSLKQCVMEHTIDIVHIHTSNFVSLYMLSDMLFKLGVQCVFSKKGISDASTTLSMLKYNYKGINAYISVSEVVEQSFKQQLYKRNWSKMHVVYDGIPEERILADRNKSIKDLPFIKEDTFIIGSVANHTPAKDLETLVGVVDILVNDLGKTNVLCVQFGGHSDLTTTLSKIIEERGLHDHIKLLGYRENVKEFIKDFNVALITSKAEGGPVFLLEALRDEVPVVTTRVGVVGELLTHSKHALISEIHDAKALAQSVQKVMEDPDLAMRMTREGKSLFLRELTLQNTISATFKIYEDLMKSA